MYTVDEFFNDRDDARANVRGWLRVRRAHPPDVGDSTADYVNNITPLGVAVFTMAGGTVEGISSRPTIRLPSHVQVSLLSAEP